MDLGFLADRPIKYTMLYFSLIIIMKSSDVELNPGPRQPKYPCQICFMLLYFLILGCFGFTGDEQCFGGPGLAGVSESFVLSRMENEFVSNQWP
jgi:hypothetical protein